MVKATDVPIGGYGVFPKGDFTEIYIKSWNQDGTRQAVNDAARDITANADCNTRSILSALQDIQTQNLQDKIAALSADNQSLRFAASQQAQNAFLLSRLSPSPAPAYIVPNPYTGNYRYNTYCGCCLT